MEKRPKKKRTNYSAKAYKDGKGGDYFSKYIQIVAS